MKKIFFVVTLLLASITSFGQLKLAQLFSDHVVLQRQKPIAVWGWAVANEKVTVTFAGQKQIAQADSKGKWMLKLSPIEAGGPYQLVASTKTNSVTVSDVLVGEVWLCSGQSNMEWPVSKTNNFPEEKRNANFPQIRHFFVAHDVAMQPQETLKSGEWKVCSPATVGDFTAVGYFFARDLYQKLNVPIGLVHSSWGGSQIEGWISKEGMESSDAFKTYATQLPKDWIEADQRSEASLKEQLFGNPTKLVTKEEEKKYVLPNADLSAWKTASYVLSQWDWQGIWAWRGNGYMAKDISIPAEMVSQVTTLGLAECYSYNEIYINGKLVSAGVLKGARKIILPENTWKAGDNRLVVKMNKVIEPAWFGMGISGSPDDLFVSSPDEKIQLPTFGWKLMPAFAEEHSYAHLSNNVGTAIYNAMIAPLIPFGIRGALWYQGETNAGRAYQYRQAFPLMIEDWRKKWNDKFDFHFVQLANFGTNQSSNEGSNWAELREAQTMTLALPKTGMAVITDIGNPKDIHPTNKQDVGKRLAASAYNVTYGEANTVVSPLYQAADFKGDNVILSFTNTGSGLMAKDKFGYVKGFEVAGEDKKFVYAKAEIKGDKVILYVPSGMKPVAVRYAWSDSPDDANVFNKEGFPLSSFRTDTWKGVTEEVKFK